MTKELLDKVKAALEAFVESKLLIETDYKNNVSYFKGDVVVN